MTDDDCDDEYPDEELLTPSLDALHVKKEISAQDIKDSNTPYLALVKSASKTHYRGVPIKKDHNQKMTDYVATLFLHFYALTGRKGASAQAAGITRHTVSRYEKEYPEFEAEVEEARQDFIEWMERETVRRAFEGTLEPIVGGKNPRIVTYKRVFSDRLAELMLRRHAPEHYSNKIDATVKVSGGVLIVGNEVTAESESLPVEEIVEAEFKEIESDPNPNPA